MVIAVLATISSFQYADLWQDKNPTRGYIDQVRASLDQASKDGPVPLINDGVPQEILWSFRYPENTYAHLFRPWADQFDFPRSAIDDIFVFDDSGELTQAVVHAARRMEQPRRVAEDECPYPLADSITAVPLDGPVVGTGWWVVFDYDSDDETPVHVLAGDEAHDLVLPAGEHEVWLQASGTFRNVKFTRFPDDTTLCISDLALGTPSPLPEVTGDTAGSGGASS